MCGYECVRHEGIRIVYIMDSNTCIRHAHVALKNSCKREAKHEHNPHQSAGLPDCMHINECGTTAFESCILWIGNACIRHAHTARMPPASMGAKHEHNPHQSAGLPDCMHINECGSTAFASCILWIGNACLRHAHVALKNSCKREGKHEHNPVNARL